jgi:hypothetical protein
MILQALEFGSVLPVCAEVFGKSAPHLVFSCIFMETERGVPDQTDQRLISNQ